MRVLFLTWEFPPLIAGGLGTACYGMVKGLLNLGVEVDLILPTVAEAYFPLRTPEDADLLPIDLLTQEPEVRAKLKQYIETVGGETSLIERLKLIGVSPLPESYLTPGYRFSELWDAIMESRIEPLRFIEHAAPEERRPLEIIRRNLVGPENLFRKVQELAGRMTAVAKKLDFDLIHAHDWLTYPSGLALQELTGKPLLAHIHATEFDRAGGVGDERIHKIEYAGMSGADAVVAVSRYTAEMVINRYSIDPALVSIIHNAHTITSLDSSIKQRILRKPLILFLGRITLQKGPDYFIDVAQAVLARHPEAYFVMAGTGDMMHKMIFKSADYRLRNHLLFTNFLNRREVDEILQASDILIMPSVSEPFGIVPLEAMAHGAAAVISKQSGVSEVLENAVKVDFWDVEKMAEVVCDLLDNPDKRRALAQAGRREVRDILWIEAADKIRTTYYGLIHNGGGDA